MLKNAKKILIFIAGTIRILVAKGSVNLLCTNVTSVRYKMLDQYLASTLILMRSTVQVMVRKMPLIGIAGLQVNHEIVVHNRCRYCRCRCCRCSGRRTTYCTLAWSSDAGAPSGGATI